MTLLDSVTRKVAAASKGLPSTFRETARLRAFGFLKIPLLFFVSPSVIELSDQRCVVKVPLKRRTKNHLGSMYFGVLACGADCAGGLIAWRLIERSGKKVSLIFKDFHAEFLKRAEGDVYFTSEDGERVAALVEQALKTGERVHEAVHITATVPSKTGDEPVAKFTLTLSLKRR
jgi:acyl-coenzyme A thioesterase PaaI-like protein